jgi:ABC-type molybdenum transport system ATPase subunit/photorepair protein PhrA
MSQPNIDNPPVITLDHITIRIRDKFILADTSWAIQKNQHWAIIGPNGAGKSTLVRAIVKSPFRPANRFDAAYAMCPLNSTSA